MSDSLIEAYITSFNDSSDDIERMIGSRLFTKFSPNRKFIRNVSFDIPRSLYHAELFEYGKRTIKKR